MRSLRLWLGLVALCGMQGLILGAEKGAAADAAGARAQQAALPLTQRIDQLIAAEWSAKEVTPAPASDDAEFMRRVYLDIAGRIPPLNADDPLLGLRGFLADPRPNKRALLIDKLLESPGYVNHYTTFWRTLWLTDDSTNFRLAGLRPTFEAWLRGHMVNNTPYDKIVHELMTVRANQAGRGMVVNPQNPYAQAGSPAAFFQANEYKPDNLASSASRLFLGVNLGCAQCHNHPFATWKREQFWQLAAFFAGFQQPNRANRFPTGQEDPNVREIKVPDWDKTVQAAFLDNTKPNWDGGKSSREVLADWMVSKQNPFFAKAAVNRLWAQMMGIGLVEPVDDLHDDNPASHPELLEELARDFIQHNFDLKHIIRAIANSRAYQLSSRQTHPSQDQADGRLFGRMALRGMTPEQLYDSLVAATYQDQTQVGQVGGFGFNQNTPRADFLSRFSDPTTKPTEAQTSILQALLLMNGQLIQNATDLEKSPMLSIVTTFPLWDTKGKLETLYLATLSRKPTESELARLMKYVDGGGVSGDPKKALADVFWALLNSGEFMLNR